MDRALIKGKSGLQKCLPSIAVLVQAMRFYRLRAYTSSLKNRIFVIAFDCSKRRVWPCHLKTVQTDSFKDYNGPLPDS